MYITPDFDDSIRIDIDGIFKGEYSISVGVANFHFKYALSSRIFLIVC